MKEKTMKNKIVKIISKPIFLIIGVLMTTFLKTTHALAQGFDPNTMVVYAAPEVFACGDNKLCLLLYGFRRSWVFAVLVLVVLLAIIFGIVKLILKIIRKKRQNQNTQQQKTTDEPPKQ
ncbi:MAG: hypothetical protein A2Z24_00320 [Candidatus Woykebacteria bacterium RBG_16_44_10]|uniref:Uncharacterized protein n=1 Tax=Candidatus Woykebacteria bacterium RBG_16_44_10 TaxID=1802597 RepID=A0A1G1WFK8_9BACT|nr:MAG: hypothetical protein A2Z24_00320 [Candidatus Woykebacteria bacterium RBG_16_44_10]